MESTTTVLTRPLGRSGLTVSALGVGTWAPGGPFTFDGPLAMGLFGGPLLARAAPGDVRLDTPWWT